VLDVVRRNAPDAAVLLASSAAVYGAGHDGPIAVDAPLRPFSPYGHHKRMVEQLAQSFGESYALRIRAVRLFSVYGEGLRKQLLFDLCQRLLRGETDIVLGGNGREVRDWCHVEDVVALLPRLLANAEPGFCVVNGGGGAVASVAEVAEQVLTAWGGAQRVRFSGLSRAGDPFSLIAAPDPHGSKASSGLPLAEGIGRYVAWFKATFGPVPA
jgi:UDP-glucose 4-epimerase